MALCSALFTGGGDIGASAALRLEVGAGRIFARYDTPRDDCIRAKLNLVRKLLRNACIEVVNHNPAWGIAKLELGQHTNTRDRNRCSNASPESHHVMAALDQQLRVLTDKQEDNAFQILIDCLLQAISSLDTHGSGCMRYS